jgi:hypothetical protein
MGKILLTFILTTICSFSFAESLTLLNPSSVTVEKNSGDILEGVYDKGTDVGNDETLYKLLSINMTGHYDEVVLLYTDVPAGNYQFRFTKITKPKFEDLYECESGTFMDSYKNLILYLTERISVLSDKGEETAEIRLTSSAPVKSYKIYFGPQILLEECQESTTKLQWATSKKLSTDWTHLIVVKTAKNLVLRIPKEAYDNAGNFELAVVKK